MAGAGRQARKLIIWRGIVAERIVQQLAEFVAQRKDVGKKHGITEKSSGDIGIERGGKGESLHENLVVYLAGFKRGVEIIADG